MVEIKRFKDYDDFRDFNSSKILRNYFSYVHFLVMDSRYRNQGVEIFDFFNLMNDAGDSCMCVHASGAYFIYGENWDSETVAKLALEINPNRFKDFCFIGIKELIVQLLDSTNTEYEVDRDRIVYECSSIKSNGTATEVTLRTAGPFDFDEIVQMSFRGSHEQTGGEVVLTIDDYQRKVGIGITLRKIFLVENSETICSIAQAIDLNEENHTVTVGNFYTKPEFRGKGYGAILLQSISNGYLEQGWKKCGLIADRDNPASNRCFQKAGYVPIYNLLVAYIA